MKSKTWWVIFAFVLWSAGSSYYYVCKIKGFCQIDKELVNKTNKTNKNKNSDAPIKITKSKLLRKLVSFNWSKSDPVIADSLQWTAEVKSIVQLASEGKKLRIQAPYFADEENTSEFDNLGIARANKLKAYFDKDIAPNLIITEGKLVVQKDTISPVFANREANDIQWITSNNFVKETQGKTLIYFPYNSSKEIKNKAILSYLDNLVVLMQSDQNIELQIVGYTDNIGSDVSNVYLGKQRAKRIKNVLRRKGIVPDRIFVDSKGAQNFIGDNKTKQGRQKNRRVEMTLIKSHKNQ